MRALFFSLIFPVAAVAVVWAASGPWFNLFFGKYAYTGKDLQELIGPSLLGGALTLAAYLSYQTREFWRIWLAALLAVFLCRELHFPGTSTGVYVGAIGLGVVAWRQRGKMRPLFSSQWPLFFLAGALGVYAVTVSVDQGVWKFLPGATIWGANVEETLESCGHLLMLFCTIATLAVESRRTMPNAHEAESIRFDAAIEPLHRAA